MTIPSLAAALTLVGLSLLAGVATARAEAALISTPDPVVEPEALASQLRDHKDVRLLDVRKAEEFAKGHVVGAVNVDIDSWFKAAKASGPTDTAGWAERLGALGIGPETRVLVYDGGGMTMASAAWFVMQHFGVRDAAVVSGGWKLIPAVKPELITIEPTPAPKPAQFKPAASKVLVAWADKAEVRKALDKGSARIWDARSADEYTGKQARDNPRVGHLPGSVNLPHGALINDEGRVRSAVEIREILTAAGFKPGDRIVAHCQGGGRSSFAALAAVRAGFGPVENYLMSFGEWAADETCPVVKPGE